MHDFGACRYVVSGCVAVSRGVAHGVGRTWSTQGAILRVCALVTVVRQQELHVEPLAGHTVLVVVVAWMINCWPSRGGRVRVSRSY